MQVDLTVLAKQTAASVFLMQDGYCTSLHEEKRTDAFTKAVMAKMSTLVEKALW